MGENGRVAGATVGSGKMNVMGTSPDPGNEGDFSLLQPSSTLSIQLVLAYVLIVTISCCPASSYSPPQNHYKTRIEQLGRNLANATGVDSIMSAHGLRLNPQQDSSIIKDIGHLMRAIVFALCRDNNLQTEIRVLEESFGNLRTPSQRRLIDIEGGGWRSTQLTPRHASRLGNLHELWVELSRR